MGISQIAIIIMASFDSSTQHLYNAARNEDFASFIAAFNAVKSAPADHFYNCLDHRGDFRSTALHWALHRFPNEMTVEILVEIADAVASLDDGSSRRGSDFWSVSLNEYQQTPTQVISYWTNSVSAMELMLYLSPISIHASDTRGWDIVALCKRSVPDGIVRPAYSEVLACLEAAKSDPLAFRERFEAENPHLVCRNLEAFEELVERDPRCLLRRAAPDDAGSAVVAFAVLTNKPPEVVRFLEEKLTVVRTLCDEFPELSLDQAWLREKMQMWDDV